MRQIGSILMLSFSLLMAACLDIKESKDGSSLPKVGTFTKLASMPEARHGHTSQALNGKVYVIGGNSNSWSGPTTLAPSVLEYDPSLNTWTSKSNMGTPRNTLGSAIYNNKIYTFGGALANNWPSSTVEAYDPSSDTWTTMQSMPLLAYYVSAATVGSKIYVFPSAQNWACVDPEVYSYDPNADSWTALAKLAVHNMCGRHPVIIGTDIYLVGRNPIFVYDTVQDQWSSLPVTLSGYTGNGGQQAFLLNGLIYMFDQNGPNGNFQGGAGMQVMSVSPSAYSIPAYTPKVLSLNGAAAIGNKVYISGGAGIDFTTDEFYLFEPL